MAAQLMDGRRSSARFRGYEFIEVLVTQCVPAARADKMTVEINFIADDALDRAVWRAVEHGI